MKDAQNELKHSENQTVACLFAQKPVTWGLRGDPFLWAEFEALLSEVKMPCSETSLSEILTAAFVQLTGISVEDHEPVYLERFAHGGLSSGRVSPAFWYQTAFPLILERYRNLSPGSRTPDEVE